MEAKSQQGYEMTHVENIQRQWKKEMPHVDTTPQRIIGRLHRLALHLTKEITPVYRRFGLSEGEFDILCAIRREGPPFTIRPVDIAKSTMITTGGTTKRLEKLEQGGFISKKLNTSGDKRSKMVQLTDKGRNTIEDAFIAHMMNEKNLVSVLTPVEQDNLEKILIKWLLHFEEND